MTNIRYVRAMIDSEKKCCATVFMGCVQIAITQLCQKCTGHGSPRHESPKIMICNSSG